MTKRALLLTAATAALLSGQAYGATNPNPPCSTTTSTASPQPQLCDITTGITVPLSTGTANPNLTTTTGYSGLGNVTIDTNGSLTIGTNPPAAPAITINSGTTGIGLGTEVNNVTNITYTGVNYAVGVLMEEASVPNSGTAYGTAENWVGEYYSTTGTINLTGAGDDKVGILFAGGAYYNSTTGTDTNAPTGLYANQSASGNLGVFTGIATGSAAPVVVDLAAGSTLEVQGTYSYGIELIGPTSSGTPTPYPIGGATVIGDIDIGGTLAMTPTTIGATTATGNVAIDIAGWMQSTTQLTNPALTTANDPALTSSTYPGAIQPYVGGAYAMVGNLNIVSGATVSSEGAGAEGVVVLGAMDGGIINAGTLETFGTTTPSTAANATDPEAGSALVVANNITGGIYNSGTISTRGGTAATPAPTIDISTALNPYTVLTGSNSVLTIGTVTSDTIYPDQFSLDNRGTISAQPEDASNSSSAISISGTQADSVTLLGGIYNGGAISAVATTNTLTQTESVTATALSIGNYVTVGTGTGSTGGPYALINTNEIGSGSIKASVSGPDAGVATAILIAPPVSGNTGGGNLVSIFNSGTISASATTTTLTQTGVVAAYAIEDESGTLTTIVNQGTISATATTLDDSAYITNGVAIDTSKNTTSQVTITDEATASSSASITGNIKFGELPGILTVTGNSPTNTASVTGNIYFGNLCTSTSTLAACAPYLTKPDDTLTIGAYGTVTGEIKEQASTGVVNITIDGSGTLNLLTTLPANLNSTAPVTVSNNSPLNVGTLTVDQGGLLDISLSQGNNVNAFTNNVTVINATTATIGGDGITPTLQLGFGSYIAVPGAPTQASEFVLISTPSTGSFTITSGELTLLETNYDGSHNNTNGIPFLFTSDICAYNLTVTGGTAPTNPTGCPSSAPYNATNSELVLTLTPKTASDLGLTGYAAQMFKYANEALVNDNTLGAAMVNDITDNGQAQAAYAAFTPDVSGATRATAISLTDSATNVVAARQRELRMYVGQEGDTTLWGQQFAQRLSQNGSKSGLSGWNDPGFGFAVGLDGGDPVDGRYGGAFTFFGGGMSQKGPTDAKTQEEYYLLTGYTDWRGKGLFLDTQASVGYGSLKGKRYLTLTQPGVTSVDCTTTSLCREADSNRATELLSGGVTTGAIFNAGATVFTPQLSVDGMTMREEGYTESGGGQGFDLSVRPYYADSLRAFLGADVRQDVNFGDFYLQPDLRVGYRYDFANGAVKLRANFASVNPAINKGETLDPFTVEGPDPGHGNLVLGGGFAATTGAWSLGLNYDYVRSGSGPTEQDGVLTLVGRI